MAEREVPNQPGDPEVDAACRGAPSWITPGAVRDTLRVFGPLYKTPLSPADAVEILSNTGRLFEVLRAKGK